MKKYLVILSIGFLTFSCSTEPTKEEIDATKAEEAKKEESTQKKAEQVAEKKPVDAAPQSKYIELEQSIASKNQERIKKASSDILVSHPKDIGALNALGMYYYQKNQFDAALLLLDKALAVNPLSSALYNNFGLIALSQGKKREAIDMYRKSLELNDSNYSAASSLATIYLKENDYAKAAFVLEKSVKNETAEENGLGNYGVALVGTGKVKEGAEIYEKVLKMNPAHKNTLLNYSILMIENLGKYKEGLDLINRLKFVGSDIESRQVIKDLEVKAKAGLK